MSPDCCGYTGSAYWAREYLVQIIQVKFYYEGTQFVPYDPSFVSFLHEAWRKYRWHLKQLLGEGRD